MRASLLDRERTIGAGAGRIVVEHGARGSAVTRAFATSPLKWLTPRTVTRAAWVFSSSYGGGLVDGDALAIDVTVGDRATLLLSTQASTKVYRSPLGTRVDVNACVGEHGLLVHLPDPVVCFAGARYEQRQTFELSADGALIALDWMTSGRLAYGERWAFREYRALTRVILDGHLLVHDAVRLSPTDGPLEGRLGRFDVLAAIVIAGRSVAEAARRAVSTVTSTPVSRRPAILLAAAPLRDCGCVVRIAGMSIEEVRATVRRLLEVVPDRVGDDPWARKW